MKKLLVIYSNSDSEMRQSVQAMLYSFENYLPLFEVYYHNAILNRAPAMPLFRKVDYIIFHHSVTTVWNRKRYLGKIKSWLSYNFGHAEKIALMQDEYKNVDLVQSFIRDLAIDKVFSLAPESEWLQIYGREIVSKKIISQYLAGYLESIPTCSDRMLVRDIDIGYRTDWTKMHVKLGKTGLLKRDIATVVKQSVKSFGLVEDIEFGSENFIKGDDWGLFLQRCRYVIGVPSGSSVFDPTGEIENKLLLRLGNDPTAEEQQLYDDIVANFDDTLKLEVLSPRHFEAMLNGCAQILIESEYNGILKPWEHYLPLKRDFSNLEEILSLVSDEDRRLEIVENCNNDIVSSGLFSYQKFVSRILPGMTYSYNPNRDQTVSQRVNSLMESVKIFFVKLKNNLSR